MLMCWGNRSGQYRYHGPCYQGAHIPVEERDNEKVTNQIFPDFHKCSKETKQNVELKDNGGNSERKLRGDISKEVIYGQKWAMWVKR